MGGTVDCVMVGEGEGVLREERGGGRAGDGRRRDYDSLFIEKTVEKDRDSWRGQETFPRVPHPWKSGKVGLPLRSASHRSSAGYPRAFDTSTESPRSGGDHPPGPF